MQVGQGAAAGGPAQQVHQGPGVGAATPSPVVPGGLTWPHSGTSVASAASPSAPSTDQASLSATRSASTVVLPAGRRPSSASSQLQGSAV
ncbi:hypothetical protein GXW82_05105 [Streptacidiphilus sp. 4-A2]|nr:hypothetical protein [Streptacidiphilus sp. 4-A2]